MHGEHCLRETKHLGRGHLATREMPSSVTWKWFTRLHQGPTSIYEVTIGFLGAQNWPAVTTSSCMTSVRPWPRARWHPPGICPLCMKHDMLCNTLIKVWLLFPGAGYPTCSLLYALLDNMDINTLVPLISVLKGLWWQLKIIFPHLRDFLPTGLKNPKMVIYRVLEESKSESREFSFLV